MDLIMTAIGVMAFRLIFCAAWIFVFGTVIAIAWWIIKAPWTLYRWQQQRRERALRLARKTQVSNGPQSW